MHTRASRIYRWRLIIHIQVARHRRRQPSIIRRWCKRHSNTELVNWRHTMRVSPARRLQDGMLPRANALHQRRRGMRSAPTSGLARGTQFPGSLRPLLRPSMDLLAGNGRRVRPEALWPSRLTCRHERESVRVTGHEWLGMMVSEPDCRLTTIWRTLGPPSRLGRPRGLRPSHTGPWVQADVIGTQSRNSTTVSGTRMIESPRRGLTTIGRERRLGSDSFAARIRRWQSAGQS